LPKPFSVSSAKVLVARRAMKIAGRTHRSFPKNNTKSALRRQEIVDSF